MFGKIFKYDFRAMAQALVFAPAAWALSMGAALLIRLMGNRTVQDLFLPEMIAGVALFFTLAAVACFPYAVLFLCLRRYYKHFYSDEGYLTFTLPVKRETLLASKTLSACLVFLLAIVAEVIAIILFILLLPEGPKTLLELVKAILPLFQNGRSLVFLILTLLAALVAVPGELAAAHFAITLGQVAAKKHKILAAIGIWYGISAAKRMITQGFGLFFMFRATDYYDTVDSAGAVWLNYMNLYLFFTITLEAGCFFLLYFFTSKILKNKLALA